MESISLLLTSIADLQATADIITDETMEAAAEILAQAPGLTNIQIGDSYINGYYFNMQTEEEVDVDVTQDDVSVQVYTKATSKTQTELCAVTIIPCLIDDTTTPPTVG